MPNQPLIFAAEYRPRARRTAVSRITLVAGGCHGARAREPAAAVGTRRKPVVLARKRRRRSSGCVGDVLQGPCTGEDGKGEKRPCCGATGAVMGRGRTADEPCVRQLESYGT